MKVWYRISLVGVFLTVCAYYSVDPLALYGAISSQQRAIHYLFDENENYVGTKEDITRNKISNNK